MTERTGLDPQELAILENYGVEDWERFARKWHPVTRQLVIILAGCESQQRADIATGFADIPADGDEYMGMVTHLAALSDQAFDKIKKAIDIK